MALHEEYPCSSPVIPLPERVALQEAGRLGLVHASRLGSITEEGRRRAADQANFLASEDPEGPYTRASELLYLGGNAVLQCIKNHALNICPFRCPKRVADNN